MRTACNIVIIISLLFFPWWLGAALTAAACFLVPRFFEAILYGILFDALYGTGAAFHGFAYAGTAFSAAVLTFSSVIRKRLLW